MPRTGKSIQTESTFLVVRDRGERERSEGHRFLQVKSMFWNSIAVMVAKPMYCALKKVPFMVFKLYLNKKIIIVYAFW